jgi:hypothetical protein
MTSRILLLVGSFLVIAATASTASAQYFPLGNVINAMNNGAAAPPRQDVRPDRRRSPAMGSQKRGRPTHIIPPQSSEPAWNGHRETSAPSEDNG